MCLGKSPMKSIPTIGPTIRRHDPHVIIIPLPTCASASAAGPLKGPVDPSNLGESNYDVGRPGAHHGM